MAVRIIVQAQIEVLEQAGKATTEAMGAPLIISMRAAVAVVQVQLALTEHQRKVETVVQVLRGSMEQHMLVAAVDQRLAITATPRKVLDQEDRVAAGTVVLIIFHLLLLIILRTAGQILAAVVEVPLVKVSVVALMLPVGRAL